MASFKSTSSQRPTLPPLHSLNLLPGSSLPTELQSIHELYDFHDSKTPTLYVDPRQTWTHIRQASISSTSSSRTPSLSPPPSEVSSTSSTTSSRSTTSMRPPPPPGILRIVLADSFDDADCALVFPPPNAPFIPTLADLFAHPDALAGVRPGAPLLLVGAALQHLRHPDRRIAKGARVHPYRVVRPAGSRRASTASVASARTV